MLNITNNRIIDEVLPEDFSSWDDILDANPAKSFIYWICGIALMGIVLLFLPWTQNIQAKGKVTALFPSQRPQEIESALAGRIEKWYVNEGDTVRPGDTILHLSEIKDEYFDPNLLDRTARQIEAKSLAGTSYSQKAKALGQQKQALLSAWELKTQAAENYLRQAYFKQKQDSIDWVLARVSDSIAILQLDRWERLFAQDLKSQTDLEKMKKERQEAESKLIAQNNKWAASRVALINAQIELDNVKNEYGEKLQKAESERQSSLSSYYDAQATVAKMENQMTNYQQRTSFRYVIAPQPGIIDKALKAGIGETIKEGDAVVRIMPVQINLAAEVYVRPVDMPLIKKGQPVRLEFDGWPAIIFGSGWPIAAFGTFGGKVFAIDNAISEDGRYRILIEMEDPENEAWP
ncbi:MAG: HlyD family efflux transporter periplasmic adaptor subunit, partial [Bacteroidota bacterium]